MTAVISSDSNSTDLAGNDVLQIRETSHVYLNRTSVLNGPYSSLTVGFWISWVGDESGYIFALTDSAGYKR